MNKFHLLDEHRSKTRDMTLEQIQSELFALTMLDPERRTSAVEGRIIALTVSQREKML